MHVISDFPITKRWPPAYPDRLQLYSLPTPNGVKVSIMLEEIGLPYEPHLVDFNKGDQKTPEFLSLNPNGKIPAIIDPNGPGGNPLPLFESGAILQYLAEKTSRLLPDDAARRWETIQWVYFQMAFIGPMFSTASAAAAVRTSSHGGVAPRSRKLLSRDDPHSRQDPNWRKPTPADVGTGTLTTDAAAMA